MLISGGRFFAGSRAIEMVRRYVCQRTAHPAGGAILNVTSGGPQGLQISAVERHSKLRLVAMRKKLISALVAFIALAGSPTLAAADLFSATRIVIAIVADDLFVGEAEGHLSGAGTLAIHSQKDPNLTCRGQFTSSGALGGSGQLQCSDGSTATFEFKRLTVFSGYGVGSFGRGTISFAYGIAYEQAGSYLTLPAGKKLMHNGTALALADL
jgi:hypothetical protein